MARTANPWKLKDEQFGKADQSVCLVQVYELKKDDKSFKVKIDIRSNGYEVNCHARVYVWSPVTLEWNLVHRVLPGNFQFPTDLYYLPKNADIRTPLNSTEEYLKKMAVEILF